MASAKVHVLDVKTGDVLVVKIDTVVTDTESKIVYDYFKKALAEAGHLDVPVLVVDRNISLEVIRKDDAVGIDGAGVNV